MAASKSRGLGKGLEALFSDVEITVGDGQAYSAEHNERVIKIDIHKIKPNTNQPRKHFDNEKIEELAESIRIHGIIQPIMVRETEVGFEIVAGERRWRAARKAGLKDIPCIVRELTDEQNMLVALIENMQREDLNPVEEALGIQRMISAFGLTQEEVSVSLGKSRPYITNALRLLKLPAVVRDMVIEGALTSGHARVIAGVKDEEKQIKLAEKCVALGWSVRDIEKNVRNEESPDKIIKSKEKSHDLISLEEELKDVLGTKVNISKNIKKGKIQIEYYSKEELDRIVEMLLQL